MKFMTCREETEERCERICVGRPFQLVRPTQSTGPMAAGGQSWVELGREGKVKMQLGKQSGVMYLRSPVGIGRDLYLPQVIEESFVVLSLKMMWLGLCFANLTQESERGCFLVRVEARRLGAERLMWERLVPCVAIRSVCVFFLNLGNVLKL